MQLKYIPFWVLVLVGGLALAVAAQAQTVPTPPASVTATSASGYVYVSWPTVTDATHYSIDRSINGAAYTFLTSGFSTPSYNDNAVAEGLAYRYRVYACKSGFGCSTTSTESNVVVYTGGSGSLTPPTSVNVSQSGSSLYVSWPAASGATYYGIERSVNNAAYAYLTNNLTSLYYNDSAVTSGLSYRYKVYACSSSTTCSSTGTESSSIVYSSGGGGGGGSSNTVPPSPTSLTATVSGTTVSLTWPSVSGATHYNVYRSLDISPPAWSSVCGSSISGASCNDISVPSGTYKYGIEACTSGVGCSGVINNQWTYSSVVTVGEVTGSSCSGLALTLTKSSYAIGEYINYTWTCTPGGTANSVTVQLMKPDASVVTYNSFAGSASTLSLGFSTSNLTAGNYTLRVCFTSTCSPVTASAQFVVGSTSSGTPPPMPGLPIGPVSLLVGQSGSFTTTLNSSSGSELQAVFDWGDGTYFSFSSFIGVSAADTASPSVSHSFASPGTYNVRVKAKNISGLESGWSGYLAVTVTGMNNSLPVVPSNLRVVTVTTNSISLGWTDNASNEDKFNIERKFTTTTDWSAPLVVQLQGANITAYSDTTVTAGSTYDYRVQACTSGTGCSAYTYLSGVTAGTAPPPQTAQPVTVQMLNGTIVSSGLLAFVRDGLVTTAGFKYASSTIVYLLAGTYDLQPSFPGINSYEVQLTGASVASRKLTVGNAATSVYVSLPARLSVNISVYSSSGQPISGARVEAGMAGSTVYAAADTDGSGVAWLQLPTGTYQTLLTKTGFLASSVALSVTTAGAQLSVTLEPLSIAVSGRILAGTTPKAGAVVRAVKAADGAIVIVSSNDSGNYTMALKAGTWHLYALSDGYATGDGGVIELLTTSQTRDITLGAALQLVSSSANIVPTVSVTVTAAELGVTVGLPANALGSGVSASVSIRESSQSVTTSAARPLPGSVREVTAESSGAAITTLGSAVSIEFDYTEADLAAAGASAAEAGNLKLAFWDVTRHDWEVLSSVVDASSRKVRATTNHFTLFAIVLPFISSAQAQAPTPSLPPADVPPVSTPALLDDAARAWAALMAEGTRVYVSGPDSLAQAVGLVRDAALEAKYAGSLLTKLVTDQVDNAIKNAMLNFITYGTTSTLKLGAGERAGVVASFRTAFGRWPQADYDWQEVLKIANGRWPGTLNSAREAAMASTFKTIYIRPADAKQANDNAALAIMAYGLRNPKRNLSSEAAAIRSFRAIFSRTPVSADDWDTVRAIAYSGAKR